MIAADLVANLLAWSLQVAAIIAVASLLPRLFRLDAAGVRYLYWRLVAMLCLALPWMQPYRAAPASSQAAVSMFAGTTDSTTAAVARTIPLLNWGSVLLWMLAIGIVLRFGWLAAGLSRLQRLRRNANCQAIVPIDNELQRMLGTHCIIRYLPDIEQPITFGLFRPIVMLPETLRAQPREIQQAVIGHELLHVRRRDWAWLIVEEIAVCLFWFHPASWWLASQIQHAREELVDELAIQLTGRRKAYVEALLAFADATSVVPTAAFARRRHLFHRIALVSKESVMSSRRVVATCAAMALIVGTGSWYAVSAFPLRTNYQSADQQKGPGPLEGKAHKVTPENPIPRRLHYEAPVVPDFVPSTRGSVGVQVTLDDVGRVAEARVVQMTLSSSDYNVTMSGGIDGSWSGTGDASSGSANTSPNMKIQIGSVFDAVVAAVRQWRYDPPAEAPLTFVVQVPVKNGPDVMEFKPASGNTVPEAARQDDALRVGGNIKAPKKIRDVRPIYPPIARQANVTGVVIIEARIGADGFVEEAHVLKSIPLLDEAALDAVKQWQFEPTLMNGQPVPIIMTLTINFAQ